MERDKGQMATAGIWQKADTHGQSNNDNVIAIILPLSAPLQF
jgi:hypothetical protein